MILVLNAAASMSAIRVTTLSPGVTESELGHDITVGDTKAAVDRLLSAGHAS
jgi:NADP-dependent 3-hydroxy acid dehydrogenase YdfG